MNAQARDTSQSAPGGPATLCSLRPPLRLITLNYKDVVAAAC